ncbi:MAG: sulfotransferase family 2 domain-containing protein [Deltaproteobacteria bacterium]|nr:sulfotransferase family 2 domain-containing protein [Deltaproteobacteria bacterium]MBW2255783.1 sulfotransferase family 2 domain-containing protein [Deltaproteobacteria bacterium]
MIAFAHIQKTGGVTMNSVLRRSYGTRHCDVMPVGRYDTYLLETYSGSDHRWTARLYPRLLSIAGHLVKPHSDLHTVVPEVRYFTMLREPLKRMASHYQHVVQKLGRTWSFRDWAENALLRDLQTHHIGGTGRFEDAAGILEERCFLVGLVERYDESLVLLRRRAGEPEMDIRYIARNVATDNSIRDGLLADPDHRRMLADLNREDVKLYRFVVEDLYPRFQREYGATLEADVAAFRAALPARRISVREQLSRLKMNLVYRPLLRGYRSVAAR